jgi:hypothetical protein
MFVCMHNVGKFYRIFDSLQRSLTVHSNEKVTFKVVLRKYLHTPFTLRMIFLCAMMIHYIVLQNVYSILHCKLCIFCSSNLFHIILNL